MRILIFSITFHPFVGGAEIAIKEICERLPEIEFDLITLRFDRALPKFERIGNINVYRIGFTASKPGMADLLRFPLKLNKYIFPFLAAFKARRLQQENKYDIAWAMMAAYAGFAVWIFHQFRPRVPYLLSLQEGDPLEDIEQKTKAVYPIFKKIFQDAGYIQAISSYLADWAKAMGAEGQVKIVPNAVDFAHFSQTYSEADLAELRTKLGKKDRDIFLVHTGRFVSKNGLVDIISALALLPGQIKLLLLGIGPEEEKLRCLAKEIGVDDRVIFFGFVGHEDLPKFLQVSDIFVRPSLSEGLGNSFLEAMAAGLPVIGTQVGGIKDFLFDPEKNPDQPATGWACAVNSPEEIARQVLRIIQNKNETETISGNARQLVKNKFEWKIVAEKMGQIFREKI